ncbi:MAG TPA: DUF1800 domain-containing protein [Pyrinomonadaceae bacterium]|nr:DUF1800 domain-containing protein [Pyrinomonadaceae bacterium]
MKFPRKSIYSQKSLVAALVMSAMLATQTFATLADTQKNSKNRRLTEEQKIIHVLNRLGFGARPGDVERVKAMGLEKYINEQLNPETISDVVAENKVRDLGALNMTTAELYEKYPQPGRLLRELQAKGMLPSDLAEARENRTKNQTPEKTAPDGPEMNGPDRRPNQPLPQLDPQNEKYRKVLQEYYQKNGLLQPQRIMAELHASRILRAVYSERQLQEVMVDFWTNHFNVFAGKGADRWLLPAYDRDTIRPNAMGKFSQLLIATAQSPAMLFYLDNFQSVSPNANRGRAMLRQNLQAQQPRRGINENYARELMELHTLGVDGGYTQKDVQEVARCFTGWTIFQPRGGGVAVNAMMGEIGRRNPGTFFFNARAHDDGEKTVLGQKIPAGGGMKDGLTVLEILAHHPSTAKFIASKLVRHFVSDTPPQALVDRVAAAFTKNDGDIRQTLKAIFSSPEFNSPEAYRAKIKRPFELVVSAIRTLGADTNGGPGTHQWIARMGEPLYGFQTPNGYSDAAESWVNTGGLLERMNFGLALAGNRVQGTRVDLAKLSTNDKSKLIDQSLKMIVAGDISTSTRETLMKQIDETDSNDSVAKVVGLILGTPEFQRQ